MLGSPGQHRHKGQSPSDQNTRALGLAQPALHVSLLVGSRHSCGQLGTGLKGQELKEVGGTSSCCLGPLGGRSSSSQTMRVIFSQRFNTSQLASEQGGSPPPSPPRWQAGPAHCLRCPCVTVCLSRCFSTAPANSPSTLQSCQRETKNVRV